MHMVRNLNVWENHPGFIEIMKNMWASHNLDDNEIRVVNEKFKNLKKDLRVWNKKVLEH